MRRTAHTALLVTALLLVGSGCGDVDDDSNPRDRDDRTTQPESTTSTQPPETSTSIAGPTSTPGAPPGQGSSVPAPGPTF